MKKSIHSIFHLLIFCSIFTLLGDQSVFAQSNKTNLANHLRLEGTIKKIKFDKNGAPLDYHEIAGYRWQHLQDMLRLPDYNGKQYFMGTFSQNVSGGNYSNPGDVLSDDSEDEGGMVFVAELEPNSSSGKVVWIQTLNNAFQAGGFNHPGDIRLVENMVLIAGQNWDGDRMKSNIKSIASNIGQQFGDAMKLGNGGQAVLFYDISNPSAPEFKGKLDSYRKDGTVYDFQDDVSDLQVVRRKEGEYHIWVNAGKNQQGLRLKSKELSPDEPWEWVRDANFDSAANIYFINEEGEKGYAAVSRVSDEDDRWLKYGSNSGHSYFDRIVECSFESSTVNITVQDNRVGHLVYANVESDDYIEIEEIETINNQPYITDLYLLGAEEGEGGDLTPPEGYYKIDYDLNDGAGGDDIYLCYSRDPAKGKPITDIVVVFDEDDIPKGYDDISNNQGEEHYDLNSNAGGEDIFMAFRRKKGNTPITAIGIIDGGENHVMEHWDRNDNDLNDGAGGDDIFLIYTKELITKVPE